MVICYCLYKQSSHTILFIISINSGNHHLMTASGASSLVWDQCQHSGPGWWELHCREAGDQRPVSVGPKRWGQWSHQTQRYVTCWVSCPSSVSLDTDNSQHCTNNDDHNLAGTHSGHPRSVQLSRDLKVFNYEILSGLDGMSHYSPVVVHGVKLPLYGMYGGGAMLQCQYTSVQPVYSVKWYKNGKEFYRWVTHHCCQCDPVWHWSHTCLVSTVNGATLWRFSLHYTIILQLSAGQARSNNNSQCWGNHSWCKCHVRQQSESILSRHWTDKIKKKIFSIAETEAE